MEKDKQQESIKNLEKIKERTEDKALAGKLAEKINNIKNPVNK
jgi:hypothetical protein